MTEKTTEEYTVNARVFGFSATDGIIEEQDVSALFPKRKRNSHKGDYGSANIIAGSDRYPGAAALAVSAALKSGCGYVKLTTTENVKLALAARYPQVIYLDKCDLKSRAIAIGMGCGVSAQLYDEIKFLTQNYYGTLIIDADGLNCLSEFGADILIKSRCSIVLTPHLKEFSRLTGKSIFQLSQNPVGCAREFADKYGAVVLLKGAASVITDGGRTKINTRGTTALAKGGSGDMLSGYIAGSAARGLTPFNAAVCAAYTMGLSAEISSEQKTDYCATADDILKNLHFAVKRLTE